MRSFPSIDMKATGQNIKELRINRGYTVKDLQAYLGLELQAIYKWQRGENLPSTDHLFALAKLFDVAIEDILIQANFED